MAEKRDYYEVLGIDKSADAETIKKAYRKKAKEYHPDLHPGDAEAEKHFKEVNEAYAVLSDDDKKSKYDMYGHAGVDPNNMGGAGFGDFAGGFGFDIGDIFGDIFGGGRSRGSRRNAPVRGDDLRADVRLTFEEAAFGTKKDITYKRVEKCPDCSGSGAAPGTSPETCPICKGNGTVRRTQRTMLGMMSTETQCENCRGTGKIIKSPCKNCKGKGYIKIQKSLSASIPAGIDNGQRIRLEGQGNDGRNGGGPGDLYVFVSVAPHKIFERNGYDIYCTVPVTITEAALGGDIRIPTLEGDELTERIEEGTQNGKRITVRGRGIVRPGTKSKGNLIADIEVEIPRHLNKKQKEALAEFAKTLTPNNNQNKTKFYNGLNK